MIADAEERDVWGQEAVQIEHMDVLERTVLIGEGQVDSEKLLNILGSGIIDFDSERFHLESVERAGERESRV